MLLCSNSVLGLNVFGFIESLRRDQRSIEALLTWCILPLLSSVCFETTRIICYQ